MKKTITAFSLGVMVCVIIGCSGDTRTYREEGPIVAFGDSLTEGYGIDEDESYPAQLSERIGETVINEGVSGETTEEALNRVDTVLKHKPRIVLLLLGGNDALQKKPATETFAHLATMIDQFHEQQIRVVMIGVRGGLQNGTYKESFKNIAKEKKIIYVPDVLKGIFGKRDLMYDAVHPNAAGYAKFVERLHDAIKKVL